MEVYSVTQSYSKSNALPAKRTACLNNQALGDKISGNKLMVRHNMVESLLPDILSPTSLYCQVWEVASAWLFRQVSY